MNGLRAEIVYVAQPVDCTGTVIPAYMDINDAKWDEDPRVQHWRRETQLGRMPRRETPKTVQSSVSTNVSAPGKRTARDPRLKTDTQSQCTQPVSTVSQLQLQQQHIQRIVQQLTQHGTSTSASVMAAAAPAAGPLMKAVNLDQNILQFKQLPHLDDGGVSLPLGTAQASSQHNHSSLLPPPSVSVESANTVCSSVASTPLPSVTGVEKSVSSDAQKPESAAESSSEKPASASIINKPQFVSVHKSESNSVSEQRKVDYHNNPRFKRKTKSSSANQDSNQSTAPVSDSKPSASESGKLEAGLKGRDVLQFQSPLAVADNTRLSTAGSGYNRPPNKRYQELLEQGNQQPSRDRSTGSNDPRRKHRAEASDSRQLEKTTSVHSTLSTALEAVATYSGIISDSTLSSDSLAKGSLKDMFKTIDPTASPFC